MRWPNVELMLGQRRRRGPNVSPTLGQRLVLAGIGLTSKREVNAGLMLGKHRRPWTNIKTALGRRILFAGQLFVMLRADLAILASQPLGELITPCELGQASLYNQCCLAVIILSLKLYLD